VYRRQQFKILTDEGKLKRYENGVYYIPKKSRLGVEISMLPDDVIECKYISRNKRTFGYYSGFAFANQIGITTQMPSVMEIVTNEMGNPIKRIEKGNRSFIVRKTRTQITENNVRILQFMDLLKDIEQYSELNGKELTDCLARYVRNFNITKSEIDKYLPLYPHKIYKSIYETGLINVFA
jgi:predicted transcriptional regulator of viral defense system